MSGYYVSITITRSRIEGFTLADTISTIFAILPSLAHSSLLSLDTLSSLDSCYSLFTFRS